MDNGYTISFNIYINRTTMLRILSLQQWFNLSDPGVEEAIYDRNSF